MATEDSPILKAGAARSVFLILRFFPVNLPGALVLSSHGLRHESIWHGLPGMGARIGFPGWQIDIPAEDIATARVQRWPSRLPLLLSLNFLAFVPIVRRYFEANLTVEARSRTYHFGVRDPEEWVRALRGMVEGA